jgi:hypothetical protein
MKELEMKKTKLNELKQETRRKVLIALHEQCLAQNV